jgi:hypothetical protein
MQGPRDQLMATSEKLSSSKWRSGTGSLAQACPLPKFRSGTRPLANGLEWNGCFLFALCVHSTVALSETPPTFSLRKEVIQPQVLLRLPCYDFTPIMNHTLGRCLPCGSACRLLVQSTFVM